MVLVLGSGKASFRTAALIKKINKAAGEMKMRSKKA